MKWCISGAWYTDPRRQGGESAAQTIEKGRSVLGSNVRRSEERVEKAPISIANLSQGCGTAQQHAK